MPPSVASLIFGTFILWLFLRERKNSTTSAALWLPVIWVWIVASKPVSLWLAGGQVANGYEDSPLDRVIFLFLITSGLLVVAKRRFNWSKFVSANKWLVVFFIYLGISIVWSPDPFVAFKRWTKDVGNILMVLVIASEENTVEATKAFFARCAYLLIPLSVLVVKYYPGISRRYDQWTFSVVNIGISLDKNIFGISLFICSVSLFWLYLESRDEGAKGKMSRFAYFLLMIMTLWLLVKARSSTASVCTLVGVCCLLGTKFSMIRAQVKWLMFYAIVGIFFIFTFQVIGVWDVVLTELTSLTGRDPTLHGRTEIWKALLNEDINPLVGTGYYSFWTNERNQALSAKYYYSLGEAHNGYLETYLNTGLVGLSLLLVMLLSSLKRIQREVLMNSRYAAMCLAFMIAAMCNAISEVIFNRLNFLWFVLLLVSLDHSGIFTPIQSTREVFRGRFQNANRMRA